MAGVILEARKVTRRFGGLVAVNEVDFAIEEGSIASLIGPKRARSMWTSSAPCWLRSRSQMLSSARMLTSIGATAGWLDLPTEGRSTWPGFTSGAVTMKITSSTSMTSM